MKKVSALLFSFLIGFSHNANAERQMLRSVYDLGDPSGYCLDIPGFGPRMRKDAPINTHTCKYNRLDFSVDEQFDVTDSQQLRLPEYNLCLSAGSFESGSDVFTVDCGLENAHGWTVHDNGRVTPIGQNDLCLTLGSDRVFVNTAVGNLVPNSTRPISLEHCARGMEYFQAWRWSALDEQDTPSANTLRQGMSISTAVGIRELGYAVSARETAGLFAGEPRMFSAADVSVSEEISYGSHEQQRLQVYHGLNRNNPRDAAPVVVLVHGGGFARGGLNSFAGAATHLAALGYVVVNTTYPLAPDAAWPSGARSVAAAVRWVQANAEELKADAGSIFLLGQSAGATNVADFVFRPSLIEGEYPTVSGAILAAPAVELEAGTMPAPNADYFGEDTDEWLAKQVLGNIESAEVPVLILVGEFEPEKMRVGAAKLFHELIVDKGTLTRFRQLLGHNHTSYVDTMGTADTRAAEEILDFMATAGQ